MRARCFLRLALLVGLGIWTISAAPGAFAQQPLPAADEADSGSHSESNAVQPKPAQKEKSSGTNSMTDIYPTQQSGKGFFGITRRLLDDQQQIWTSPSRLRLADTQWLLPMGSLAAGFFATDAEFNRRLSHDPGTISNFKTLSDVGVGALVGGAGGMWLLGHVKHNEHWSETGFLSGEAALNSLVAVEALKYSLRRDRPYQADGSGAFFQSGGTSFPSEHSAAAWAVAGVIAHEYPGTFTKIAAYGLASLVSFSRVKSQQHFNSDVFIGALIGNMVAQDIYARHADPELGGAAWGSIPQYFTDHSELAPNGMGTTYVPLDSWVYPAFERLAAMGYTNTAYEGLKPWARTDCARIVVEARDALQSSGGGDNVRGEQARSLINVLAQEFGRELALETGDANESAQLGSVYSRVLSASGSVLTDGYHFGQTYGYDFGRTFRRGTNLITGSSGMFTYGRVFLYVSGEYQHSPSAPGLTLPVRQFIADRDEVSLPAAQPFNPIDRFTLLDTYVGMNLGNWQVSIGKQSLDWGPGVGGSLLLSDNAEPLYMVRFAEVQPFDLPWIFSYLGPMRLSSFIGRERGHEISGDAFLYGQKISLKPFASFEFSFGRTTTLGGSTDPFTTSTFVKSYFGRVNANAEGVGSVPGDSHTSIDWTWRVPGLQDRVVFYGELEADDDPIPLQNLTKAVLRPGIYLPSLPFLKKWDFHAEWTSSETPGRKDYQGQGKLNYWNQNYRDGYTNQGNLLGNIVGREGKGVQVWTRYWISPVNTLDLTCKLNEVDSDFMPGGAKWQDYAADYETHLRSGAYFRGLVQFEHISHYPFLYTHSQNNVVASVEIGFQPWPSH